MVKERKLLLSHLKADGVVCMNDVELPINPAGNVRVDIGKEQYNYFWK